MFVCVCMCTEPDGVVDRMIVKVEKMCVCVCGRIQHGTQIMTRESVNGVTAVIVVVEW